VHITCAGRTDVGIIRSGNEDSYLMVPDRGIFVVADGMGGHAAGEVASEMAVRFVARDLGSLKGLSDDLVAERMRVSIRAANNAIFQRTLTEHDKRGMGTTVTALVLYDTRFLVGQVGDSRCYLLREGRLTQITKDHSYVQEQVDAGYLTPEQARAHPYSNVITRCVGANSDVMPDVYVGAVRPKDVFLLASDGLTGMLEDHQLAEVLHADRMPQDQVDDNITAIIVRIDSVEQPEADTTTAISAATRPR
jgi:protein phosphatase